MTDRRMPSNSSKTTFAFDWQLQVARDGKLKQGSYRLALYFAQTLWSSKNTDFLYYSKTSQGVIADKIDVTRKTVQEWFKDLIDNGHLSVTNRKGQGVVNHYMPILKAEAKAVIPDVSETVEELTDDLPELQGAEEPQGVVPSAGVEMFDPQTPLLPEGTSQEEIYALEANRRYDIEALRNDRKLIDDETELLSDLFEAYLSAFPQEKRDGGRPMARIWFLTLVHRGFDPSQIIGEAREYIRAAQLAAQPVRGPLKWAHSRVVADSAERRSA